MSTTQTIVPMYIIMAGVEENQGIVLSKAENGVANLRQLDENNWYLIQTNDDHFSGVCQERCQDAIAHMDLIGQENINLDTLLNQAIL